MASWVSCLNSRKPNTTVGSKTVAMFGSLWLFVMWCLTVWESRLGLAGSWEVFDLSFPMVPWSCDLDQLLWRYAHFKVDISLQQFLSFHNWSSISKIETQILTPMGWNFAYRYYYMEWAHVKFKQAKIMTSSWLIALLISLTPIAIFPF